MEIILPIWSPIQTLSLGTIISCYIPTSNQLPAARVAACACTHARVRVAACACTHTRVRVAACACTHTRVRVAACACTHTRVCVFNTYKKSLRII